MLPARLAPFLFAFVLSGLMSFLVSGITMLRAAGMVDGFLMIWVSAWLPSWAVACPAAMVVGPIARRCVTMLVADAGQKP